MHSSQWLYNSPVFPDSLHWSENQLLLVNVGSTVVIANPYSLQKRGYFSTPRGLDRDSETNHWSSQNDRIGAIQMTLETIKEFVKQDSGWTATIRASCWSPRSHTNQHSSLIAVLQSDNRVLIYGLPNSTTSEVHLLTDLTQSLEICVKESEDWTRLESVRTDLRLRGGGRKGRVPLTDKTSEESKRVVREYQLPEELDATIVPSLEANDSNRFRIDLPKVVLSLWLEIRSRVPNEELPKYRKGDQLFGIDRQIYEKVMRHVRSVYGSQISLHGVDQKFLETRSRSLIRKKAIVSFDTTIWRGNKFLPSESVLSLIGQGAREDSTKFMNRPQIIFSTEAALVVQETNKTIRLVKRQSGQKRKNETEDVQTASQSIVVRTDENYGQKLTLMSPLSIAWSPEIQYENQTASVLAIGLKSGHTALCWCTGVSEENPVNEFHFIEIIPVMKSEITVLKWKEYSTENALRKVLFLLTGDVTGVVKLWTFDRTSLLQGGYEICTQDDRPVYCAHMGITRTHHFPQLVISVGKTSGSFAVWQSPSLSELITSTVSFSGWTEAAEVYWKCHVHHCQTITGITYTPYLDLIITVGLDSQVQSWRIQEGEIRPGLDIQNCPGVQPIYGVATSPTGMMLALVKDLGEKFSDAQVHRMAWQRVASGSIDLIKLIDLHDKTSWQQAIDHLRAMFNQGNQDLSALAADIGFFVKWCYLDSKNNVNEEESKSQKDRSNMTIIQFLKVVFDLLDGKEEKKMRAYNALYYTLKELPQLQIDDSRVQVIELRLLESYVHQVLDLEDADLVIDSSTLAEFEDQSPLMSIKEAMTDWIFSYPAFIDGSLLNKAIGFMKEDFNAFEIANPITAATQWQMKCGNGSLVLDRCYVTFQEIKKVSTWKCLCCSRCCIIPYSKILQQHQSICLFCGTTLTCLNYSAL